MIIIKNQREKQKKFTAEDLNPYFFALPPCPVKKMAKGGVLVTILGATSGLIGSTHDMLNRKLEQHPAATDSVSGHITPLFFSLYFYFVLKTAFNFNGNGSHKNLKEG